MLNRLKEAYRQISLEDKRNELLKDEKELTNFVDNICEYDKINRHPLEGCDETPEEYYRRKINSPDWGAY